MFMSAKRCFYAPRWRPLKRPRQSENLTYWSNLAGPEACRRSVATDQTAGANATLTQEALGLLCSPQSCNAGGGGSRHIDGKLRVARRGLHWPLGVLRRSLFAVLETFLRAYSTAHNSALCRYCAGV
jgi:hypothetical protein